MKDVFNGFISRLDTVKESVRCEIVLGKYFKLKCQEKKKNKIKSKAEQELWDNFQSCNIQAIGMLEGREKEEKKNI